MVFAESSAIITQGRVITRHRVVAFQVALIEIYPILDHGDVRSTNLEI